MEDGFPRVRVVDAPGRSRHHLAANLGVVHPGAQGTPEHGGVMAGLVQAREANIAARTETRLGRRQVRVAGVHLAVHGGIDAIRRERGALGRLRGAGPGFLLSAALDPLVAVLVCRRQVLPDLAVGGR